MKITSVKIEHEFNDGTKVNYFIEGNTDENELALPKELDLKKNVEFLGDNKEYKLTLGQLLTPSNEDINKYPFLKNIEYSVLDYSIPDIKFSDITEKELLGFEPIRESELSSTGLWMGNGFRRIKVDINNFFDKITEDDVEYNASFKWVKKDNDGIEIVQKCFKTLNNEFYIQFDTNRIGEEFTPADVKFNFTGIFIFEITYKSKPNYSERIEHPVVVVFNNPETSENWLKDKIVAVDFGTSSTCVAYNSDGGTRLMTFVSNPLTEEEWYKEKEKHELYQDPYETPTAINVFNWESIYKTWDLKNDCIPHFIMGEEGEVTFGDYWYGYNTKSYLKDASDRFFRSAILNLKYIPNDILKGKKPQISPFNKKGKNFVNLIDNPEKQDIENFNPIAFYGYLIGKSLNRQSKGELYTTYKLTTPVKFKDEVRESTRKSLEYGLRRSLPLLLRNKVTVDIDLEESIAFAGGVIGKESFKIIKGVPAPFAVFDFGGGTLDFAFGIYRNIEEGTTEERFDKTIDVFKIDGYENIGGEHLIDRISYEIYKHNKELMKENEIPFNIPDGEEKIEYFPDNLLTDSVTSNINMKILNERFSRRFFMNMVEKSATNIDIEFISMDEKPKKIKLTLLKDDLEDKIYNILENSVKTFRNMIERIFEDNISILEKFGFDKEFDITDVRIFKGGNASKCWLIEEVFNKIFSEFKGEENKIFFINESGEKGIKPKNAVAKGIIEIERRNIFVKKAYKSESGVNGLIFNVGDINDDDDIFEIILDKGNTSKEWKKFGKVNSKSKSVIVYYTTSPDELNKNSVDLKNTTIDLKEEDLTKNFVLYVRTSNIDAIEWCLSTSKDIPGQGTKGKVLKLK